MGESQKHALRVDFDGSLRLEFNGSTITSDAGLLVAVGGNLPEWGCGGFLGLYYAISPRLWRYSDGLNPPSDSLMRPRLYRCLAILMNGRKGSIDLNSQS